MNHLNYVQRRTSILLLSIAIAATGCGSAQTAELAGKATEEHHVDWTYSGADGPEHWGELGEGFTSCCYGVTQSPIDIQVDREGDHEVELRYAASHELLVNNGHTIQLQYDSGSQIVFDGQAYNLLQFHFHTPSEHEVGGKSFPMEAHLVHLSAEGEYLVVSVLFEEGDSNAFLEEFVADAPATQGNTEQAKTLNVGDLFPDDLGFYHYAGSFTTPPCTEGVTWLVLDQPAQASASQIKVLALLEGTNNRPEQTKGTRVVEHFR